MALTLNSSTTSYRDWKTLFQFNDSETGDLIDFTGAFIAIAVEDADGCQKVLATTDNGKITIISTGIFELSVPYTEMDLCPGSYPIGGYYQANGETVDAFEGSLSIRKGIPKP